MKNLMKEKICHCKRTAVLGVVFCRDVIKTEIDIMLCRQCSPVAALF